MDKNERLETIKKYSDKVEVSKEKKKPCGTCKKKKTVITEEIPLIQMPYIPDINDIQLAYAELTSYGGIKEEKKEFISKVYKEIFNEELIYDCNSCVSTQARKFKYYINNTLKIPV